MAPLFQQEEMLSLAGVSLCPKDKTYTSSLLSSNSWPYVLSKNLVISSGLRNIFLCRSNLPARRIWPDLCGDGQKRQEHNISQVSIIPAPDVWGLLLYHTLHMESMWRAEAICADLRRLKKEYLCRCMIAWSHIVSITDSIWVIAFQDLKISDFRAKWVSFHWQFTYIKGQDGHIFVFWSQV